MSMEVTNNVATTAQTASVKATPNVQTNAANTAPQVHAEIASQSLSQVAGKIASQRSSDTDYTGKDGVDERQPTDKTIEQTIQKANKLLGNTKCEFSYNEPTHRVSIKILDKNTDEVIKEIPPEKSLEMLQKMWEMAGILVDDKR